MSANSLNLRSKIHFSLLVLLLVIPSGCCTSNLWAKHFSNVESSPELIGKFDSLYINSKDHRVCIPYQPHIKDEYQQHSLLINAGKYYKLDIAQEILRNNNDVKITSIITNIQQYKPLRDRVKKQAVLYLFWSIPDANIAFEKDENGYYFERIMQEKYEKDRQEVLKRKGDAYVARIGLTVGEEELLKKIIQDKWKAKFGHTFDAGLLPVAWIDRQGQVVAPSAENESTRTLKTDDIFGIVAEIRPALNGYKYIRLQFNVKKHISYATHRSFVPYEEPRILNVAGDDNYFYVFGALPSNGRLWQDDVIDTVLRNEDCNTKSPDWISLPLKGFSSTIYSNNRDEQLTYKNPLLVRAIASPFTVAADIVTFPLQLIIIIYGPKG